MEPDEKVFYIVSRNLSWLQIEKDAVRRFLQKIFPDNTMSVEAQKGNSKVLVVSGLKPSIEFFGTVEQELGRGDFDITLPDGATLKDYCAAETAKYLAESALSAKEEGCFIARRVDGARWSEDEITALKTYLQTYNIQADQDPVTAHILRVYAPLVIGAHFLIAHVCNVHESAFVCRTSCGSDDSAVYPARVCAHMYGGLVSVSKKGHAPDDWEN